MKPDPRGTRVLCGIDEAGLGPLLGPLVLGCTAFETPVRVGPADLWRRLSDVVSQATSDGKTHLIVADSKRVHQRTLTGERRLERTALTFLSVADAFQRLPADGRALWKSAPGNLGPTDEALTQHPWYECSTGRLTDTEDEELLAWSARLERALSLARVRPLELGLVTVPAGALNACFEDTGNKSLSLWRRTSALLQHLWRRYGERHPEVVVDSQGGRRHYTGLLARAFPGAQVCQEFQQEGHVGYLLQRGARCMRVAFRVRAEEYSFPVALASCLAKFGREVAMRAFNEFFHELEPRLSPTAGYVTDGRRWLEEAKDALERARLAPRVLVRER